MRYGALVFPLLALFAGCGLGVERTYRTIDPHWQILVEDSHAPEAGGYHPHLRRNSQRVHVIVDRDTYDYKAAGDDCVVWYGLDSRGLYIACGDRQPLLLDADVTNGTLGIKGDRITFDQFSGPLAEAKERARRQPELTNQWKAEQLHAR